ncbi:MAG TPA: amino acid adenylation domain-containing protein, partial [Pyrinomonadaceae bacterium]|nr:amino acid adenylation domain-containing protein [Pyrinomonadaceae bacterium]
MREFDPNTLAGLSADKRQLLEMLLEEQDGEFDSPPLSDSSPLSFAQQRLWFLDQLEPGNPFYNVPAAMRLRGRLDARALERSLSEIVARHEVLRTSFTLVEHQPVQVVAPAGGLPLPLVDLTGMSAAEREAEVARLAKEEAGRPFDLGRGPLLRATLLKLGGEEHVVLFTMHHIISDGWSLGILVRELSALYGAFARGEDSPLAELPMQYADFARWQRERLSGETLERQLSYWREQLAGAPAALELPADRPRPAVQTFGGSHLRFNLSSELTKQLQALGQREGATLFMVLLAAFQTLLYRYTGQPDISVGTPIANRTRKEIEGLIGFFVNTLVLRADLSGGPTFRELLSRVREVCLGAYAHQDVPFEKLVEELQVERDLSRSPLFQVMFVLQTASPKEVRLPGLRLEMLEGDAETAKFDLMLSLEESAEGLRGWFEYNTDLFDAATVERMRAHFERLLAGLAAEPDARLSEVPLLGRDERRQLLVEWNDTRRDYPRGDCIHTLFERQAAKTPHAAAVISEAGRMSYEELDRRAERLAGGLRSLGVGPESLVAVLMGRSPELLVALLGVLKAGGAYVPLDPAYPKERLAFMLEDTRAAVILTEERLADALPEHGARVLCLDSFDPAGAGVGAARAAAAPENSAYVIYTSGSTGRPKGVLIEHRSAATLLHWAAEVYTPEETRGVLASTSVCFDLSVFELFVPLSRGGSVVLAENALHLPRLAAAGEVTMINTVPSAMAELARTGGVPDSVRVVNLAGEPLRNELAQRVYGLGGVERVWNLYGPSEDTTYSTALLVTRGATREPSIGRPIADTRSYILDASMRPTPVGVFGELYLAGQGLARGYLRRPGLTAERFVPDPFSGEPGARLYRTGDVCRYRADGAIEFLGRADNQVKVRGFRIELGEVEAALLAHASVRDAVVVVREFAPGDSRLLAYVVYAQGGQSPQEAAGLLRESLRARLPEYMVPSQFVELDSLPLTANGKVDRRALPEPDATAGSGDAEYVAPRTPTEDVLVGVWAEVLGVERVSAHDNFFDLGGHSLLMTQVISRVREVFAVELPLRSLFESPTPEQLARRIESERGGGAELPPIQPLARGGSFPLSFSQRRMWFMNQLVPESPFYNVPSAVRLKGRLDRRALGRSLNELVTRHETLRTTFAVDGGEPRQVIAETLEFPLSVTDLSALPPAEREGEARRLIAEGARQTFDLAKGPLASAHLLRMGEEEHILLFTMHHIVSDGWSLGVLVREVAALYGALTGEAPAPPPAPAVQYADFAQWQREWLSGGALDEQLSYWRRQLEDLPTLQLPTDYRRPPVPTFKGASHRFTFPRPLTDALKELSRQSGVTLYMTLLASFKVLLMRYTGQEDVVVGTPIANRTRKEIEGLIGFFVNTLVLRTDLSGEPTFRGLLSRVREVCLGAYAHQDVPFEKLVEELQPGRDTNLHPLFQVMFVMQNAPFGALELPGMSFGDVEIETTDTPFDLQLILWEGEDGLEGIMQCSTELFELETARRMVGHLETLLRSAVSDPGRGVRGLTLLTEAEREQTLYAWNATANGFDRSRLVTDFFDAQVGRAPDAVALVAGEGRLTYRQLDERANRLANLLAEIGAGVDTPVAVLLERSADALVSLLAVLKSGAAYLPLDPTYPRERLAAMVEDARPPVLITEARLAGLLDARGARVVRVDEDAEEIARRAAAPPPRSATPESLAYLIYTSGSTGKPKGIGMPHGVFANLVDWQARETTLEGAVRTLQFASLSFDVSAQEIFTAWAAGHTLVLCPEEARHDMGSLLRYLDREQVTQAYLPVVVLQQLAEASQAEGFVPRALKELATSGAQLQITKSVVHFLRSLGGALYNQYGPSETHVVTDYRLEGAPEDWRALPPIGRPIDNARVYLLDAAGQPVPLGATGEICIGGECLARGYLNRPALTAEKFIPDAFSPRPGARLYRSGDLGRHLPDGRLECLGRVDHQVKIRGFRVELGEIEAVLAAHPAVEEAAVLARGEGTSQRLVAYVVPASAEGLAAPTGGELRDCLREKLPEYMIPSAFVMLGAMPLTRNGKIDRRALPEAESLGDESGEGYVAPRTPAEEVIAATWAELLGVERVGVEENFFDLGGHSLLVTQVISRVREAFGVEIPLRVLFEQPTVSGLARGVEEALRDAAGVQAPPIVPVGRDGALPLSFAQQRLWFIDQLEPGNTAYLLPMAVRLSGRLDAGALGRALGEVARRHESLRTSFVAEGGTPRQVVGEAVETELPLLDLRDLPEAEREARARLLADEDARRPFDLGRAPLLRASLLRLGEEEHVLLLTMHHIVSDGWSLGVLVRELSALYAAYAEGRPSPLPELPVQYADFAAWQTEWLQGEALERQLAYWRQRLSDSPSVVSLPADRPRPPVHSFRGARESMVLPQDLADDLKALGQGERATLFMVLLAAFQTLLYRYTGQRDISVGSPVANRNRGETENLIGFFVNMLVLRADLSGEPTFRELLSRVREVCLGAYAHQDVPFEKLVEELQPGRDLGRSPLFQVAFALQNAPMPSADVAGL